MDGPRPDRLGHLRSRPPFEPDEGEFGVVEAGKVLATDERIAQASALIAEIDQIVAKSLGAERRRLLHELKSRVDNSNQKHGVR